MAPIMMKGRRCFMLLAAFCLALVALYLAVVSSRGDAYYLLDTPILQKNEVRQESLPESCQPTEGSAAKQMKVNRDGEQTKDDNGNRRWMERQAMMQFQRKVALKNTCQKYEAFIRDIRPNKYGRLFLLEKSKLLYCAIPKTGTTNWMRAFMVMEGREQNASNIGAYEAHFENGLKMLLPSYVETHKTETDAYTKFFQVRHPFDRLLSAFRNKISGHRPFTREGPEFVRLAQHIVQTYREGAPSSDLELGNLHVTWEEWIQYLTNPLEEPGFDSHWMQEHRLCSPCSIQYDFIAHIETATDDSKYMLTRLGKDSVAYPDTYSEFSDDKRSDSMRAEYFGNLSREVIQKLYDIYKLDFELFGYEKPSILN